MDLIPQTQTIVKTHGRLREVVPVGEKFPRSGSRVACLRRPKVVLADACSFSGDDAAAVIL